MSMAIPRTVFEAADVYANSLETRYAAKSLVIRMYIKRQGIMLEARFDELDINKPHRCEHIVSWHAIEHAQYDSLRSGLDRLVEGI